MSNLAARLLTAALLIPVLIFAIRWENPIGVWAEVYLAASPGRGLWLPADPTLDQFPADATHVRLARGGLDKQAAILGLVGHAKINVLDVELRPGSVPILVGREASDLRPLDVAIPRRGATGRGCWSSPGR